MTKREKIAYGIAGYLFLNGFAASYLYVKAAEKAAAFERKADSLGGSVRVLASFIPQEMAGEVLRALDADPIVNYHSY